MPKLGQRVAGAGRGSMLAAGAVVGAILLLTLWPLGPKPAFDDDRLSMRFGLADALRNVILFLPLGLVLARRGAGFAGVALRAALLSMAIELAQVVIPGRYGNVSDVVSNASGALLGVALHRSAPRWLRPSARSAGRLALAWATLLVVVLLGTGLLLAPALPETEYYAGRTPEFGDLAHYSGHVTSALLGEESLENGRIGDSAAVRRLWLEGARLRVEAIAGAPTSSLAPVFTIHDSAHREILLLGAERGDLVLRVRTRAQAVSLDRPAVRWAGALDGVREGEPLTIGAWRQGNGWCLSLGHESACPLGFTAGSGWRLIWFPQLLPAEAAPWLNGIWLGALFVPLGLWLRAGARGAVAAGLPAGALFSAPFAGVLPTPFVELAAALAGLALGIALRSLLGRPYS
jgi:VanZ family protein